MNKNIKTIDVVSNNFFLPKIPQKDSLLKDVDTTGLSKLQKKKLKKKMKKQQKGGGADSDQEETKNGDMPEGNHRGNTGRE
jgi:hypothetical protein